MKKHILCFGDSNTHGYRSETNGRYDETQRWTCLLNRYLGEDYLVLEEGLSGRTTCFDDPLYEGLNGLSVIYPCLMTHEPVDLLIIMLGTNDTKIRFHMNAFNIAQGLERLTNKALTITEAFSGGRPNILLVAPPPIHPDYIHTDVAPIMGPGCAEKSEQLGSLYADVAARLGCHYLDAGQIPGMRMFPVDHMHLDTESHRLLAQKLAEIIPGMIG